MQILLRKGVQLPRIAILNRGHNYKKYFEFEFKSNLNSPENRKTVMHFRIANQL